MFSLDPLAPRWRWLGRRWPRSLGPLVSTVAGLWLFARNHDHLRRECMPLVRQALDCGPARAAAVVAGATVEAWQTYLDVAALLWRDDAGVRDEGLRYSRIGGMDHLREALARGRGALLFSAHFGCLYHALLAPVDDAALRQVPIGLLMRRTPGDARLIERLSRLSGRPLTLIDADSPYSARDVLATLRGNGIVACMTDFFYESNALVIGPFMGHECATPAGLARLAVHSGCAVMPQFTFRHGRHYVTEVRPALPDPAPGSVDERTAHLTLAMNEALEAAIRSRPSQWTFWRGLPHRVQWARRVTEAA